MPELPDVETFRRYLASTSLHQLIGEVHVEPDLLGQVSRRRLVEALRGQELDMAHRHGKWLFARTTAGPWLAIHFGMTGWLAYARSTALEDDAIRLRITFDGGARLAYGCPRKLGSVDLAEDPDRFICREDLGPDALSVDAVRLGQALQGGGRVKSALVRQASLAGIGNIYADEILFQAGIHPDTPAGDLVDGQRRHLHRVMRHVLLTAIDRQAIPERLPRSWLLPRREAGRACPRCGGRIERIEVAGRSTYFCPGCQPAPS